MTETMIDLIVLKLSECFLKIHNYYILISLYCCYLIFHFLNLSLNGK